MITPCFQVRATDDAGNEHEGMAGDWQGSASHQGSGSSLSIVRALLAADLVDELVLMIEPITLGGGKTLFPSDGQVRTFELISAESAATGVQVCRYRPTR